MDGVRHDVAGVHRLPERGGDAVHGHAPPDLACDWSVSLILASDWSYATFIHRARAALPDVDRHREGVA